MFTQLYKHIVKRDSMGFFSSRLSDGNFRTPFLQQAMGSTLVVAQHAMPGDAHSVRSLHVGQLRELGSWALHPSSQQTRRWDYGTCTCRPRSIQLCGIGCQIPPLWNPVSLAMIHKLRASHCKTNKFHVFECKWTYTMLGQVQLISQPLLSNLLDPQNTSITWHKVRAGNFWGKSLNSRPFGHNITT